MKKLLAILVSTLMLCAVTACGSSSDSNSYVFKSGDVEIAMNVEAAPIIEKLGEPVNYYESESCAFKGLDKQYTYSGFMITTYPKDGVDYIYTVTLLDDTVSTPEGVCIGNTKTDVETAYNIADTSTDTMLSYKSGDCELEFVFEPSSETITAITYYAQVDIK